MMMPVRMVRQLVAVRLYAQHRFGLRFHAEACHEKGDLHGLPVEHLQKIVDIIPLIGAVQRQGDELFGHVVMR